MTNREILDIYIKGFDDELKLEYKNPYTKGSVEFHAYDLGSLHAIVGDDCRSVDYLSNEEILNIIKGAV